MKGILGCDAELAAGAKLTNGTSTMIVLRRIDVEEAQEGAERIYGERMNVEPDEIFYEVEVQLVPPVSNN